MNKRNIGIKNFLKTLVLCGKAGNVSALLQCLCKKYGKIIFQSQIIRETHVPADLIVYALVAAGLVLWLRNILGTRDGDEPQRPSPLATQLDARPDRMGDLAYRAEEPPASAEDQIRRLAENPVKGMSVANKTAETGLLDISELDRNFDINFFLEGAQEAFIMIVEGFSKGDRETLKELLQDNVYRAFDQVITEREARGETKQTDIHALRKADIIEASIKGKMAFITVRFTAEETSVTRNASGDIIEGHPDKTAQMIDVWTFGREIKSRNPAWLVYETRGGFEDDNQHVPNA
jgi:predicted lipid-binding transport protein (Tim44 family)